MCRLTASDDPRIGVLFELRDLAVPVVSGKIVSSKESIVNIWRKKLDLSVVRKRLLSHRDVPEAHRWAREPTRILSGRDFIRVNHLRYNLFLTGQLKHRMCRQANICLTLSGIFFRYALGPMAQESSGIIRYVNFCRKD